MSHTVDDFIGTWALADWCIEYGDGRTTRPFGIDAVGQILYAGDGTMCAVISAARRERFDHVNIREASTEEKAAAFDSYFHYAGTWNIDGNDIVHTVTFALNPGFVGTKQRRHAQFLTGERLRLSAREPAPQGGMRCHVLDWIRSG